MDYKEAVKTALSSKQKDNYIVIEMYYDNKLILPYKDGLAFLASLVNAEKFTNDYSCPPNIGAFNRDGIKTTIMSNEEYIRTKIAALLNISLDSLKEVELANT